MFRAVAIVLLLASAYAADPRITALARGRDAQLAPPSILARVTGQSFNCSQIGVGNQGSTAGVSYYNGQPDGCPVINKIDADGSCASSMQIIHGACAGYCEVRNYYFYGQEVPFTPLTTCQEGKQCSIDNSYTATVTQTFEFNVGAGVATKRSIDHPRHVQRGAGSAPEALLEGAFNLGASLSYSTAKSTVQGSTFGRPVQNNASDCGYWTSVPLFWTSCGTMTTAPTNPGYAGSNNIFLESNNGIYANSSSLAGGSVTNTTTLDNGTYSMYVTEKRGVHRPGRFNMPSRRSEADACDNSKGSTTTNYCNTTPYKDNNGNLQFVQLFILTGCTTGKLQPIDMQPPVYQYPGVAAKPFSTSFQN